MDPAYRESEATAHERLCDDVRELRERVGRAEGAIVRIFELSGYRLEKCREHPDDDGAWWLWVVVACACVAVFVFTAVVTL